MVSDIPGSVTCSSGSSGQFSIVRCSERRRSIALESPNCRVGDCAPMSTLSSDERSELRALCRDVLTSAAPLTNRDGSDAVAVSTSIWPTMVGLGWPGVLVDEAHGGLGWGFTETAIVLTELGRVCAFAPFVGTAILLPVALAELPESPGREAMLSGIAAGVCVGTVAVSAPASPTNDVRARATSQGWRLDGVVTDVVDLGAAAVVLVPVDSPDGPALFAVEVGAPGVDVEVQPTTDASRSLGTLRLQEVAIAESARLASGRSAEAARSAAQEGLFFALACDAAGGAQRVHEMTLEYAKQREQFGQPIGSFQVIKHRLVDQYLLVESATVGVESAAKELDGTGAVDGGSAALTVSTAKAFATDAYVRVAHDAVLLHGAIGFTWEHELHRYLKRAMLDRELAGSPAWHRLRALSERNQIAQRREHGQR